MMASAVRAGLPVRALLSGFPAASRQRRLLLMLQAVFDDSGNDSQSPAFIIAGAISRADDWIVFSDIWKDTLSKYGLDYFKMSRARQLLYKFTSREQDRIILELATIIKEHVISGVSSILFYEDFKQIRNAEIRGFRSPYFVASYAAIATTFNGMISNNISEKVDFVFDEHGSLSDRMQANWTRIVRLAHPDFKPLIGGRPMHKDDNKFLPLQAADVLAWHIRRWYYEKAKGNVFENEVISLMRTFPQWGTMFSANYFNDLLQDARRLGDVRQQLRQFFLREDVMRQLKK